MPTFTDKSRYVIPDSYPERSRKLEEEYYSKPKNQYWNNVYQASDGYDLFIFSTQDGNGDDAILDFGKGDRIRFTDFDGDFDDLTFEVDALANTVTIRYDDSDNRIVLRNAVDLIENGNHLLTAKNFHFVLTEPKGLNLKIDSRPAETYTVERIGDNSFRFVWVNEVNEGVENKLKGSKFGDTLEGGQGDDIMDGGRGNDTLKGGPGNDTLDGSRGNDTLKGGKGNDILEGSHGDNIMVGGKVDDVMDSGWGADTFVFHEGDGHDTITDFGFGWSGSDVSYPTSGDYVAAEKKARKNGDLDVIQLHLNLPAGTSDKDAFDALEIRKDGRNTVIEYGDAGDTITLEDVRPKSVTIDDFDFVFIG